MKGIVQAEGNHQTSQRTTLHTQWNIMPKNTITLETHDESEGTSAEM